MRVLILLAVCATVAWADIYMHSPRGSNNRLNEATATRTTNDRMFDSQNNARGGYNVGDKTDAKAKSQLEQYRMQYFMSGVEGKTNLVIEWTNQHGAGGNDVTDPHKLNSNVVIQRMCQPGTDVAPDDEFTVRDGINTNKQNYKDLGTDVTKLELKTQRASDTDKNRGLQENWDNYNACQQRQRNKGLFTATQNLATDKAVNTRQSPNTDNQNGYECPEERDYYPYWHPTPWTDIAILTDDLSRCQYYKDNSFNRNIKHLCVEEFSAGVPKPFSVHNNDADCTAAGGVFTAFHAYDDIQAGKNQATCTGKTTDGRDLKWARPYDKQKIFNFESIDEACLVIPPEVDCQEVPWSRSNHLGNGKEGVPSSYTWTLPIFFDDQQCVLRMRYNISTDDYDPWNIDSSSNGADSPVQDNPTVLVGETKEPLQLAINTAQFGRTFQDRSHVFHLMRRDSVTPAIEDGQTIHNLNVRGKRGNIVQTFPAVEYDFYPTRMVINKNDAVHIQWTGSNSHNNGGNGGDGQTGDAGEGTGGTDRNNLVQIANPDENFPLPGEMINMFNDVVVLAELENTGQVALTDINSEGIALRLASCGHYLCKYAGDAGCGTLQRAIENHNTLLQSQLNNANASYGGIVLKFTKEGTHYFMCTRNNSFTNRSQKGRITIE